MNRIWLESENTIIRADRALGIKTPVTAAKLGRPVPATYNHAIKIGATNQPHKIWSEAEKNRLRTAMAAIPQPTDDELAALFDRPIGSIRYELGELKLIGARRFRSDGFRKPANISDKTKAARIQRATAKLTLSAAKTERRAQRLSKKAKIAADKAARKADREALRLARLSLKTAESEARTLAKQQADEVRKTQTVQQKAQVKEKTRKTVPTIRLRSNPETMARPQASAPTKDAKPVVAAIRVSPAKPTIATPKGGTIDRMELLRAAARRLNARAQSAQDPETAEARLMSMMRRP